MKSPQILETPDELREVIESSREFVRKSRVLIELSECDPPSIADGDGDEAAD